MIKKIASKKFLLSILILFVLNFEPKAQVERSFRAYHESALKAVVTDTIDLKLNSLPASLDSSINLLFRKQHWYAEELYLLDSLIINESDKISKMQNAILQYNMALAYSDFDLLISDSLFNSSYSYFKEKGDVDGQVFSLYRLLVGNYIPESMQSDEQFEYYFNELLLLEPEIVYPESELRFIRCVLDQYQYKQENQDIKFLDSLSSVLAHPKFYNNSLISEVYSAIAIQYYMAGDNEKALSFSHKAYQTSTNVLGDSAACQFNIGYLHKTVNNCDSAFYYLHAALKSIPQRRTEYLTNLRRLIVRHLADLHKQLGNTDSAYFFISKSINILKDLSRIQLEEKMIYAAKRFETAQYKITVQSQALQLEKQQIKQRYIIALALFIAMVTLALIYLLFKRRKINKETKALAINREQVVQVISHDLTDAINALLTYVKVYEEAKTSLPQESFKKLENSFINSAKSIQATFQNITHWGRQLGNNWYEEKSNINVDKLLNEVRSTYNEFAVLQQVQLSTSSDVGEIFSLYESIATLLRNLLSNAIKHAKQQTQVKLEIERSADKLTVRVSNYCSAEDKVQLVQLISHITKNTYQATKGRLGLELIATSLKRLNGRISLNQSTVSNYVCIEVSIPL